MAGTPVDANANGRVDAGDTIPYTFRVTNGGAQTLDLVGVNDPKVGPVSCSETLLPTEFVDCTAVYTITQADVDAGSVVNTATATGVGPAGQPVTSVPDSTTTPTSEARELTIDKAAGAPADTNGSGRLDAGDTIAYTFVVENTGAVTLDDVTVVDPLVGAVTCPETTLEPGDVVTCSTSYTITQDDVDAGSVDNSATATGDPPTGPEIASDPDTTSTPLAAPSALTLDKQAAPPSDVDGDGRIEAGDTIAYSFVVTNTGAVTVNLLAIDDALLAAVDCPVTTVLPGDTTTCTATYTITQADVDDGSVDNSAAATGTAANGTGVVSLPDSTTTPTSTAATLTIDKTAGVPVDVNTNGLVDIGDTIEYTFEVANTGAVTLADVTVDDPLVGPVTCAATLAPDAEATCTAVYTITQDDVNAGTVDNTATALGTPPTGPAVESDPDSTSTATDVVELLEIDKTAGTPTDADGDGRAERGDTITYTFAITNSGNVPLSSVGVTDPKVGAVACGPATTVPPGGTLTCTAVYTITQADVDAGSVGNTAAAVGTAPSGTVISSPPDSTATPLQTAPSIDLVETAAPPFDFNGNGVIDAGDTIDYEFVVTNDGDVTLTGVGVVDGLPGTVDCPLTTLAPGASTTCTVTYTLTQADVDAGEVVNPSTATGTPPSGPDVSDTDTVTTPVDANASIDLDEAAAPPFDFNGNGTLDAGDTIDYSFVVTNTGGVTLTDVGVVDGLPGTVVCPTTTLAPGASTVCTVTYPLTQADLDAGQVVNPSTATGTPPSGPDVTDLDSVTTPLTATPGISLDESAAPPVDANGNGVIDAGDTITYSFLVTNTGGVTLTDVGVVDGLPGTVVCPTTTLAPGESTTCTVTYPLTQADIDAGQVVNPATATGTPPSGPDVTDVDVDTTPIDGVGEPSIALDKRAGPPVDANGDGVIDAGDTIDYSFVVTNTGPVTLTGVGVDDPLVGPVDCPVTTLAVGASTTCTASYTITRAVAASGAVVNVATAVGLDPSLDAVESPADSTVTEMPSSTALLELDKRVRRVVDVDDDGRTGAGDQVVYEFVVTNSGGEQLADVEVDDPMLDEAGVDISCPGGTLQPGARITCVADPYTITAADVADGEVTNEATVGATAPGGADVTGNDDTVVVDVDTDDGDGDDFEPPDDGGIDLPGTGAEVEPWMLALGLGLVAAGLLLLLRRRSRTLDR